MNFVSNTKFLYGIVWKNIILYWKVIEELRKNSLIDKQMNFVRNK